MAVKYKGYALNALAIDTISAEVQDYLNELKQERANVQPLRRRRRIVTA